MLLDRRKYKFYRSLLLVPKDKVRLEELQSLLTACGLRVEAVDYTAGRRALIAISILVSVSIYIAWQWQLVEGIVLLIMIGVCGIIIGLLSADKLILRTVREQRRARIVQDVQVISSQLLYYRNSRLNIHHQLQRCVPLVSFIRKELQLLVNEWYEGSHEAILQFRRRLSTDEADDFAETLDALRQHDSESYYDLLQERIRSYKEKLELIRDGRKEATSYVLFLLSGIPILYTFLIFIYPWVAEARFLFDSLS